MGDQGCSELLVQDTAAKLFQTAALLLGNESEAVSLVEEAIAGVEIDPCADGDRAKVLVQEHLVHAAIRKLSEREPESFAVSTTDEGNAGGCIQDDDISAAGLSQEQLGYLLEGEGRGQLRNWLEHLTAAQRAIFVERAMLGQDNATTAENLRTGAGEGAAGWTPEKVSEVFRQALCSLATSLVHARTAQPA
ncbi:MAG TPA: hypothetical protein VHT24_02965 [Pseudacidobacterium sp.]|jgi:DNA-directed RNA polymerase specialized sigma24 family protein|nr:hypothetical protein [Pseudacidobacterium sp.]